MKKLYLTIFGILITLLEFPGANAIERVVLTPSIPSLIPSNTNNDNLLYLELINSNLTVHRNINFDIIKAKTIAKQLSYKLVVKEMAQVSQKSKSLWPAVSENTTIVKENNEYDSQEAIWIYTQIGGKWSLQINNLKPTINSVTSQQATSITNTAQIEAAVIRDKNFQYNKAASWVLPNTVGAVYSDVVN
jgi:hypothetical protein